MALTNATVEITDKSVAPPATLALRNLHVGLKDLRTVGQKAPAPYELGTTLGGGGTIAVKGALDLAQSQATTDVTLDAIDLPALQGFAQSALAATVASGKLTAHANVQTLFATGKFNVHAAPASISFDKFELRAPQENVRSDRMEQAERLDRAGRSRDAPGDGHRSALRRTACVRPARAQRPVEPRLADARGRVARADASRRVVAPQRGRAAARRHEKEAGNARGARCRARAARERRAVERTARERRRRAARAAPPPAPAPPSGWMALPGRIGGARKD